MSLFKCLKQQFIIINFLKVFLLWNFGFLNEYLLVF